MITIIDPWHESGYFPNEISAISRFVFKKPAPSRYIQEGAGKNLGYYFSKT